MDVSPPSNATYSLVKPYENITGKKKKNIKDGNTILELEMCLRPNLI